MALRILMADDHPTVRAGIRALLRLFPNTRLVAEASNGKEALRAVEREKPDIVLMDISMPEMDGLAAAAEIQKRFPRVKVIIFSSEAPSAHVKKAVQAGVAGYLLKNLIEELEPALKAVASGKTYFSTAISHALLQPHMVRETNDNLLTPRQQEILRLIARGYSTKEIADRLNISVKTAQTHRTQLMKRLDIHEIAGLVRYAIRNGYATSEK